MTWSRLATLLTHGGRKGCLPEPINDSGVVSRMGATFATLRDRRWSPVARKIAVNKYQKSATPMSPQLGAAAPQKPQLNPEVQAKIGQQLRKIYDDMVTQGVPDRFADLLNRLEQP